MQKAGPDCQSDSARRSGVSTRYPRQARLAKPAEFRQVFDHCRCKAGNRWMTLLAIPNERDYPRLGLVISRRTARTSVARNRLKRLVRESFRRAQHRLGGYDVVIIGRQGIALQSNAVLAQSLDNLWNKLIKTCAGC